MTTQPNDPLFQYQWFLDNRGQSGGGIGNDINVLPVWRDYTGKGVRVAIVDNGTQLDHPDLFANIDIAASWDAVTNSQGGNPVTSEQNHGTAVAGLVGEVADNGIGGSGVAPGTTLIVYRIGLSEDWVASAPVLAFEKALSSNADVVNNSWGLSAAFADNARDPEQAAFFAALDKLASDGREGMGSVVLFANGNDGARDYDGNLDNHNNGRHVIAVGAIDDNGVRSAYSTPGANLLISAPAGASIAQAEDRPGNGVLTTDRTGSDGYNERTGEPGDYAYNFNGTSAATPIVSGVVALMLEANPRLGYRDVQEILAHSARFTDRGAASWVTTGSGTWNGGGALFSRDYGFGQVDAHGAVRLAEVHSFLHGTPRSDANVLHAQIALTDQEIAFGDENPATIRMTLPDAIALNHLDLTLFATMDDASQTAVTLRSPSGTSITLISFPHNAYRVAWPVDGFSMGTDAYWGEGASGEWRLAIHSTKQGGGTISGVTLDVYGDPPSTEKVFVYTDDFASIVTTDSWQGTASRLGLAVRPDETAVINAAAVSSDVVVDLPAQRAEIAGQVIAIASGTKVTEIYSGDGNDRLVGDDHDNRLFAGRGSNTIDGGGGTDTVVFLGSRSDYAATYDATGLFTAYTLMPGTADAATRVEKAQFQEGTGYLPAMSDTGLGVVALYAGLLMRDPDADGYRYWTIEAAHGASLSSIATSFVVSPEFASGAGRLGNVAFIEDAYLHLLDRTADSAGLAYWDAALASGSLTRGGVVISIALSEEYQTTRLTGVFDVLDAMGDLWG